MKRKLLFLAALCTGMCAMAQNDPVVMTIAGNPVSRSEFEYSYNKNNSEGVIDKKSVEEYVDLFVNYKLKVQAAVDAKLDTMTSFKKEFQSYRDQQIRPAFVSDDDVLAKAHEVYDGTKKQIGERGLIRPAHILMRVGQQAGADEQTKAKQRIDSVYTALKGGADFAELAKQVSQDPGSAARGGQLPWVAPGQTLKEFEDQAYALQPGEMSQPFLSPAGYHIVLMKERKQLEPFDTLKASIIRFLESRNVRDQIASQKIDSIAKAEGLQDREMVVERKADEMSAKDNDLKYLIQEYHDGLLLYEISNREVWDKAAKDEAGLANYFNKNKKKYKWTEPRFKGIAYHVKDQTDVKAVKNSIKKVPFDKWAETLRTTFNNDSTIRIRVEKGIFKEGDNALVDKEVFKKDTVVKVLPEYPIDAVYGKKLTKPQSYEDVKGLVTSDYQDELEKQWVAELRKRYTVSVDESVLKTVNNHSK